MASGNEIVAMIKSVNRIPERRTECERCAWPLEEHPRRGLHCPLCGWTENLTERKKIWNDNA